jgi:hypothetical protein
MRWMLGDDTKSLSVRKRLQQLEPSEHAALEAGHGADPVAAEGEDEEPNPVADAGGAAQIGSERRLTVGSG